MAGWWDTVRMLGAAISAWWSGDAALHAPVTPHSPAGVVHTVTIDIAAPGAVFRPDAALGAALDGAVKGASDPVFTPHNLAALKSAGLRSLTYRLRTELGIEAWHWNPVGRWSDPSHGQGYWTSSDRPGPPIMLSWGYHLPRRGDSIDNANETDWSKLTDGDPATFWKSNPYLDPRVTRDGSEHPQWLQVRLPKPTPIDTIAIAWATPYATRYEVRYWTGNSIIDRRGRWATFPHGQVMAGRGGTVRLALTERPIATIAVRVLMHAGSGTAPPGSHDWRDRMGFAVGEVWLGRRRGDGGISDVLVHAPDPRRQSFTHVSSTDPWHRAVDRDERLEQPGIDRVFRSGLGFGQPVMMPVGTLFDTPDNAAAELRYLARRRYPVRQVELGEEPDGQYGSPADYGALYVALARRLRGIIPGARLGGPSLQEYSTTTLMLPDEAGSWTRGFASYLRRRRALGELGFFSFEYYPVENMCGDVDAKLIAQTGGLARAIGALHDDGVPAKVPLVISEYGLSAFSGRAMSQLPAGLLMAQVAGEWLSLHGAAAYMFGFPPDGPINQVNSCAGYGNMMLFMADAHGQAAEPMPTYYAARLLTGAWTQPGHGRHRLLPSAVAAMPGDEVRVYTVRRPDGRLAILAINRSGHDAFRLAPVMRDGQGRVRAVTGPARVFSYGPEQYAWRDSGRSSRPLRSLPPATGTLPAGPVVLELKPETIAVVVTGR